tara:strand:+ start:300 stop:1145 length:846 start_codon:yes stop_codon:yes gene_type:complete
MLKKRLIACFFIKDGLIVQSYDFRKYLPIGKPKFAVEYTSRWDVDEIVVIDIDATKNNTSINPHLVEEIAKYTLVPLTVGGGLKNVTQVKDVISAGADKVVINSAIFNSPNFISNIVDIFGTQCIVASIDCIEIAPNVHKVYNYLDSCQTKSNPIKLAEKYQRYGAGEIFINSVNRDGSRKGYDLNLIKKISKSISVPLITCGGVGIFEHFGLGIKAGASAVAAANIFQHIEHSTIIAKAHLFNAGIDVRLDLPANYQDRQFDEFGRLIKLDQDHLINFQK